jgi:DNA-directed RNA polymerase specialized sigma24 family protein
VIRPPVESTQLFWEKARELFLEAIESLDVLAKAYVKYRYIDGLTIKEIAAKLGISERTVMRRYSDRYKFDNLVRLLKSRIRESTRRMPTDKLYKAIYTLIYENDFSVEDVARLFCMTVEEVSALHHKMVCQIAAGYSEDMRKRAS